MFCVFFFFVLSNGNTLISVLFLHVGKQLPLQGSSCH